MLPCRMFTQLALYNLGECEGRNEGSLEGSRRKPPSHPILIPIFRRSRLTSANIVPSVLKPTLNSTRPLTAARHPSNAPIPFRITSFAGPPPYNSHRIKSLQKTGEGGGSSLPVQTVPKFSTASKHPTRGDARLPRAAARGNPIPFMRLLDVLWTPGRSGACLKEALLPSKGLSLLRLSSHGTNARLPRLHRCRGELHA
jgi:hypothetical protein